MYSTLKLKLTQFQQENEHLKQELNAMKNDRLKKEAQSSAIVDQLRSELSSEKQKLRLFVEKISDDLPHSVVKNTSSLEVIKTFETNVFFFSYWLPPTE